VWCRGRCDPNAAAHDNVLRSATASLLEDVIPAFAKALATVAVRDVSAFRMSEELHRRGSSRHYCESVFFLIHKTFSLFVLFTFDACEQALTSATAA
jgi:hypothetical protein